MTLHPVARKRPLTLRDAQTACCSSLRGLESPGVPAPPFALSEKVEKTENLFPGKLTSETPPPPPKEPAPPAREFKMDEDEGC